MTWVIREKATGRPIYETLTEGPPRLLSKTAKERYEVVSTMQHLKELNDHSTKASQWMRRKRLRRTP